VLQIRFRGLVRGESAPVAADHQVSFRRGSPIV
jgi:hypothetical protein